MALGLHSFENILSGSIGKGRITGTTAELDSLKIPYLFSVGQKLNMFIR